MAWFLIHRNMHLNQGCKVRVYGTFIFCQNNAESRLVYNLKISLEFL